MSKMTRREFIGTAAAAAALPSVAGGGGDFAKAVLLHLGQNMWSDVPVKRWGNCDTPERLSSICAADHVRYDMGVWRKVTGRMAEKGLNMLVIDMGEAVVYPSHPELSVKGSMSPDEFKAELARLRGMGIEPIPKLNFSTAHDTWLKEYERMVSTQQYYTVCADVIRDVSEMFGTPRLFHIGYDEETASHQSQYGFACVRQGELWWHDFLFFVKSVEKFGMRPWIWSDYIWRHKDEFLKRMPRSVMQSNWFYGAELKVEDKPQAGLECGRVQTYLELDKAGFDQIPCGSNWSNRESIGATVRFAKANISPSRLKGVLMAPWFFTTPDREAELLDACDLLAAAFTAPGGGLGRDVTVNGRSE